MAGPFFRSSGAVRETVFANNPSFRASVVARETVIAGGPRFQASVVVRETVIAGGPRFQSSAVVRETVMAGAPAYRVSVVARETVGVFGATLSIPVGSLTWLGLLPSLHPHGPFTPATMTWSGFTPLLNPGLRGPIPPARMQWIGFKPAIGSETTPFDWLITVISQYQNSPILLRLLANMASYIDPVSNLDAFYNLIWNVNTAQGYGLDVWGRIVGVIRVVRVPTATEFLGFRSALPGVESFDHGIFFDGLEAATQNFTLTDDSFRTLIFAKALANICDGSIPAMNQILINLFGSKYGNVYVTDGENMTMTITFTNTPSPVDLAIISQSGVFPRPAGVALTVVP